MPYFDHNATTPLHLVAREAWLLASDHAWQNPGGPYRSAARVHARFESARERLAGVLGSRPDQIVFTSGATEANNAVIALLAAQNSEGECIAVSPTEHPSVLEAARRHWGERTVSLRVDASGRLDEGHLSLVLTERRVRLVCVMAANNETGVLAPIERIASLCRDAGARLLCDVTQWIGKLAMEPLRGADYLVGGAHKYGGPKGVGFVRIPADGELFSWICGGEQEMGHRAGTENYPSIEAMIALLIHREESFAAEIAERIEMKRVFEKAILKRIPGTRILGREGERLWNTVSALMPVGDNMRWVRKLDRLGFEVSTGSACASGTDAPSHVLAAMGLRAEEARRTLRISSGWETTTDEWEGLLEAMVTVSIEQVAPRVIRVVNPEN
ncbi:MAG: cysteine desulfurase [Verrucomicrobia bacterium]|nr:MAG: cysteine desulfurase [Verrucomicrobiota bacterium]